MNALGTCKNYVNLTYSARDPMHSCENELQKNKTYFLNDCSNSNCYTVKFFQLF